MSLVCMSCLAQELTLQAWKDNFVMKAVCISNIDFFLHLKLHVVALTVILGHKVIYCTKFVELASLYIFLSNG